MYWKPVWHDPGGRLRADCWCNARHVKKVPGPQDRCQGRRSGCASCWRPGCCGRASCRPSRSGSCGADPLSQDADRGASARGQPAAQGAGGHRDQARLRRDGHPRQVRPGDARRARVRAPPTPRSWPTSPRAGCARRSRRCKEALEGRFEPQHALLIGAILAHLDFLDEQIERLSEAIEEQLGPFAAGGRLLCTIPGVDDRTAEVMIAEIGIDMSGVPDRRAPRLLGRTCARATTSRPASAAPAAPAKAPSGSDLALKEAALAATRTNGSYLQAQYQRLKPARRPRPRARRRQALDALRRLAHASPPASSTATSAATTSTPRPRTPDPTPRRPTRSARARRYAARGGGSLNAIFPLARQPLPGSCSHRGRDHVSLALCWHAHCARSPPASTALSAWPSA